MRARHCLLWAALGLWLAIPLAGIDDPIAQARGLLRKGDYEKATKAFRALAKQHPEDAEPHLGLADTALVTGKYADAELESRKAVELDPAFARGFGALAEALYTVGRYDEAEKAAEAGVKANDLELRSRLYRAMTRVDTGKYDLLAQTKELEWFVDDFQSRGEKWTERDWFYGGQGIWLYARQEGQGSIARSLVERLIAEKATLSSSADLLAMLGFFHMEWFDMPGAKGDFKDALDVNPKHPLAQLGAEMVGGDDQANPYAEKKVGAPKVLQLNPNLVDAHCFDAQRRLGADQLDEAIMAADRALSVNPNCVAALAYKAATLLLQKKPDACDDLVKKSLAVDPKGGDLYYVLGETASSKRMTMTSYEYLKHGAELDPQSTKLLISLGQCEMNIGEDVSAKEHFETAYARNKSNVWANNYLQLLDAYFGTKEKEPTYVAKTSEHYRYRMHVSEAPWLEEYATELSEACYADYAKRYHFEPHNPVTLELFPFHNDFSARTIGLPGLPAAGACLGRVVATLSPRAKEEMGPFNWGAVLAHEVSHVFSVQLSDEKTTRWFTEGLSTYEEKRRCEGWEFSGGGGWSSDLRLKTFQNYYLGNLIPIERLNEGFGGGDIIFYYYYAALIQEFIEKTWSFDKIPEVLKAYAAGKNDTQAFVEVFGMPLKDFEKKFHQWIKDVCMKDIKLRPPLKDDQVAELEKRAAKNPEDHEAMGKLAYHYVTKQEIPTARTWGIKCLEINPKNVDGLVAMGRVYTDRANESPRKAKQCFEDAIKNGGGDDYVVHWEYGKLLQKEKDVDGAIAQLETASTMFPRFAPRQDNVYKRLVDLYEQKGNPEAVERTLERWAPIDYGDFPIRMKLAAAYRAKGQTDKMMSVLKEAIWIEPMDAKLHLWLAEGYRKAKDWGHAESELSNAIAVAKRGNEKADEPGKYDHAIAELWCDLAEVRLEAGKKAGAKDAVDQALFVEPENERAKQLESDLLR